MTQTGFNKLITGLFIIGALVGLYFEFAYHKFLNNDTLSYINLAERYAAGDWQHAINGYWSPMYSWLLCFCKLLQLPLAQCCYVINFIFAGGSLYILSRLAGRYVKQPLLYLVFCLYALFQLLFFALATLTPDLMATTFCLWFLLLVTDSRFASSPQLPFWSGVVGACAYFSKVYNFIPIHLFLGLLGLTVLIKKAPYKLKQLLPLLKTYGVFIFLSAIWITLLSIHEHRLVFVTSGRLNHNLVSPAYHKDFPTAEELYAPAFDNAYSVHTNPADLLNDYDWSPFSSSQNFHYQLVLLKNNIRGLIWNLDPSHYKWLLLIFSLLIIFLNRKKLSPVNYDRSIYKIAWFFVCYPLLYLPLFIIDRYIITCIVLFYLLLFSSIQQARNFLNRKLFTSIVVGLLLFSMVPFFLHAHSKFTENSAIYRYTKSFYQHLPELSFLKDQSIATDRNTMIEATQLCYYYQCRYFSTWTDKQYQSLKQFNIRFLLSTEDLSAYPFLHIKKKMLLEKVAFYVYEIE